jgi:hypothetical protein
MIGVVQAVRILIGLRGFMSGSSVSARIATSAFFVTLRLEPDEILET